MKRSSIIFIIILIGIIFGAFFFFDKPKINNELFAGQVAEVYYSPSCGCCINYMGYLRNKGVNVKPMLTTNMEDVKQKMNVPNNMQSCHTTKIGDYFIEGHVPIEAIEKLLQEKPSISGIALPNMPSGSPGMPGKKLSGFQIYSITNGQNTGVYAII